MYRKMVAGWGFDFKALTKTDSFQAKSYQSPTLNARAFC